VRFSCDSNTTLTGIVLSDLVVHDIPGAVDANQEDGTGIFVRTSSDTRAQINGTIRNCNVYNCGRHGIDIRWRVMALDVINCKAWNCGTVFAGHGFRVNPMFETLTTGWTQVAATDVYRRLYTSASDSPQRLVNYTDLVQLTKNTSTPTTPGANEWGLETSGCALGGSGKCLYINLGGTNPDDKDILVKRNTQGPIRFINCEGYNNVAAVAAEGHGFSADDMAGPVQWIACHSHDNAGNGISCNMSENCEVQGSVLEDNTLAGINLTIADTINIYNVTADGNTTYGVRLLTANKAVTVKNALARNNTDTGIGASTETAATLTEATNVAYGNGTDFANATGNTTLTAGAGTWIAGVRAYDDLPLPLHPDIGAVQDRAAPGRRFGVGGGRL
jgi:hypothetical protein